MSLYPAFVEVSESFNKMAEELESTEMLRTDFINNFSHEFKTPIVSIAGFTRAKFNELTRDLGDRTAIPVRNALNDAGIAPSELGKVLLVGGSTRIPAVQEKVRAIRLVEARYGHPCYNANVI